MQVEIWSDINCPYCYLGKKHFTDALAGFEHADEVVVTHRSFELDPSLPGEFSEAVEDKLTVKYGRTLDQVVEGERRLGEAAAAAGLDYITSGRDYGNSFGMHRLVHWATEQGRGEALLDALYHANFAEQRPLFGDRERLLDAVAAAGFDRGAAAAVLDDPERYAGAVRADEERARELGISAVPFFVIDGRYGISGAQPTDLFSRALHQVHAESLGSA